MIGAGQEGITVMENLQGGTITLDHRYAVGQCKLAHGPVALYEGLQDPFDLPVWIHVFDLQRAPEPERSDILERLRAATSINSGLREEGLLRVIDHGELDEWVPFIITERIFAPSLFDHIHQTGTLDPAHTSALVSRMAKILDTLHSQSINHGHPCADHIFLSGKDPEHAWLSPAQLHLHTDELVLLGEPLNARSIPLPSNAHIKPGSLRAHRAHDIRQLGALAYFCLTGEHPLWELDEPVALEALDEPDDARPLSELGIDPKISGVIDEALSVSSQRTWTSASSFARSLEQAVGIEKEPAPAPTPEPAQAVESSPTTFDDELELEPEVDTRSLLLGVVLVLLVVSNLAWAMWVWGPGDQTAQTADGPPSAEQTETNENPTP